MRSPGHLRGAGLLLERYPRFVSHIPSPRDEGDFKGQRKARQPEQDKRWRPWTTHAHAYLRQRCLATTEEEHLRQKENIKDRSTAYPLPCAVAHSPSLRAPTCMRMCVACAHVRTHARAREIGGQGAQGHGDSGGKRSANTGPGNRNPRGNQTPAYIHMYVTRGTGSVGRGAQGQ